MSWELARKVADTVLFEGYVLYPYRASAAKNQVRWQFGVVAPRLWSQAGGPEPWFQQTETLVDQGEGSAVDTPAAGAALHVKVRCLQVQRRTVERRTDTDEDTFEPVAELEVGDRVLVTWEEGVEREIDAVAYLGGSGPADTELPFTLPAGEEVEHVTDADGRVVARLVRRRWAVAGLLGVATERVAGPWGTIKVTVRVENHTPFAGPPGARDQAMRYSLVAAHTLMTVTGAEFVSLTDPPEWAKPAVAACANEHTWPVLVGDPALRDTVLSSPIILYDFPVIALESPGDFFDSTEIDELLALRTMTLTEAEKREARATDDRAAAIIDRVDDMPPELLERLHGAVRYLREATGGDEVPELRTPPAPAPDRTPWWDPGADAGADPGTDSVRIGRVEVAKGSRVRLSLRGHRGADAQDMFLAGRTATVQAVVRDVDERTHLAVTLDDDPAADLAEWQGRFLYFAPEEVEPL
jgi:hypothetical protein